MDQDLFNIMVTIIGVLFGWVLKTVWEAIKDLQHADKELIDRVAGVELLVAGKYMTREETVEIYRDLTAELRVIRNSVNRISNSCELCVHSSRAQRSIEGE